MAPPTLFPVLWLAASAVAEGFVTATWKDGDRVAVEGRVSAEPWQHIIAADRAQDAVYFDVTDGGQIVAYVQGGLPEGVLLRLEGTIRDARAGSKRPGSKVEVGELQLFVTTWHPVEPQAPAARPAAPPDGPGSAHQRATSSASASCTRAAASPRVASVSSSSK